MAPASRPLSSRARPCARRPRFGFVRSKTADVGVRVVLAVGVLLILGVFALEMSGKATRTAGSDHVGTPAFAAIVPGGGTTCQPVSPPPPDTGSVRLLIGTYGRPVPTLTLRFLSSGVGIGGGALAAGAQQGWVTVPLRYMRPVAGPVTVCLRIGGRSKVAIAGESGPGGTERVNGKPQPGDIGLLYNRRGRESWWQLLPTLDTRFGLGKASFFGDWTLPVMAILLIGIWVATIRLLDRELR